LRQEFPPLLNQTWQISEQVLTIQNAQATQHEELLLHLEDQQYGRAWLLPQIGWSSLFGYPSAQPARGLDSSPVMNEGVSRTEPSRQEYGRISFFRTTFRRHRRAVTSTANSLLYVQAQIRLLLTRDHLEATMLSLDKASVIVGSTLVFRLDLYNLRAIQIIQDEDLLKMHNRRLCREATHSLFLTLGAALTFSMLLPWPLLRGSDGVKWGFASWAFALLCLRTASLQWLQVRNLPKAGHSHPLRSFHLSCPLDVLVPDVL